MPTRQELKRASDVNLVFGGAVGGLGAVLGNMATGLFVSQKTPKWKRALTALICMAAGAFGLTWLVLLADELEQ